MESPTEITFPAQIAFSVSKKLFKRAVRRNLIRRRIKEAYRRNKHTLYNYLETADRKIIFIIIYKDDIVPDFQSVERSVIQIIGKLISELKR